MSRCPNCGTPVLAEESVNCFECGADLFLHQEKDNILPPKNFDKYKSYTGKTDDELIQYFLKSRVAVSAFELSDVLHISYKGLSSRLEHLCEEGGLASGNINDTTYYWAAKYTMDLSRNLLGPYYSVKKFISKREMDYLAMEFLHFPKKYGKVGKIRIKNVPIWRVPVGSIYLMVNALNGSVFQYEKDLHEIYLPYSGSMKDKAEVGPLNLKQIPPSKFSKSFHYPVLNRDHAKHVVRKNNGFSVNPDEPISLIWYPIYEVEIIDRKGERILYFDAVFGYYFRDDPFFID